MQRYPFSSLSVKAIAILAVLNAYPIHDADAQDAGSDSIIAPPEEFKGAPYHGSLGDVASEAGKKLGEDVQTLRQNLAILHDLNSDANRDALDKLGKNYANIDGLGSHFSYDVTSIDTAKFAENSDKMVTNIQGTMDAYGKASTDMLGKLSDAIKSSPYSAQNPPDKAGATELGQEAKQMATQQLPSVLPVLGINYVSVIKLDNNIGKLNADLVSVTKTYLNLLKLTEQSPSTLAQMPDLPTELATINGLAAQPMRIFGGLTSDMAEINDSYSNLKDGKGPVKDEVGAVNKSIGQMNEAIRRVDDQMELSLGAPVPVAQNAPEGSRE